MDNYYLGIDLGGTNTYCGIVGRDGQIHKKLNFPTRSYKDFETLVGDIYASLNKSKYYGAIRGIGIGAPNGNYLTGKIQNAPNLPWRETVEVTKIFSSVFGLKAKLDNDANTAASGEMIFGSAKSLKNFVVITLGTGLGSGIVLNRKVWRGTTGLAGELGHICIKINGRKCNCGNKGCLETYASATGIKRTALELLATSQGHSRLSDYSVDGLSAKDIDNAAKAGDPVAIKAFEQTATYLGAGLANAAMILYPQAFIITGGLSLAGNLLMKPLKKYFDTHLMPDMPENIQLLRSSFRNNDAAILGAASLLI